MEQGRAVGLVLSRSDTTLSPFASVRTLIFSGATFTWLFTGIAASSADPGWGDDYLEGQLEPRARQGDAIVDVWGRPLLYVCRVLPGSETAGSSRPFNGTAVAYVDETLYGLGPSGRRSLAPYDSIRQQAIAADPPWLPDPAVPLHADVRIYAAPAFTYEFELWSAGTDGRSAWMRDDPLNRDNLSARDYAVGLR